MVIGPNGKIKEITRQELYRFWLNNHLSGLISFPDFYNLFARNGVVKAGSEQSQTPLLRQQE
jgi:hypothetical protein